MRVDEFQERSRTALGHGVDNVVLQPLVDDEIATRYLPQRLVLLEGNVRVGAGHDGKRGLRDFVQPTALIDFAHHRNEPEEELHIRPTRFIEEPFDEARISSCRKTLINRALQKSAQSR
jgi:hypothetical protein